MCVFEKLKGQRVFPQFKALKDFSKTNPFIESFSFSKTMIKRLYFVVRAIVFGTTSILTLSFQRFLLKAQNSRV